MSIENTREEMRNSAISASLKIKRLEADLAAKQARLVFALEHFADVEQGNRQKAKILRYTEYPEVLDIEECCAAIDAAIASE